MQLITISVQFHTDMKIAAFLLLSFYLLSSCSEALGMLQFANITILCQTLNVAICNHQNTLLFLEWYILKPSTYSVMPCMLHSVIITLLSDRYITYQVS